MEKSNFIFNGISISVVFVTKQNKTKSSTTEFFSIPINTSGPFIKNQSESYKLVIGSQFCVSVLRPLTQSLDYCTFTSLEVGSVIPLTLFFLRKWCGFQSSLDIVYQINIFLSDYVYDKFLR